MTTEMRTQILNKAGEDSDFRARLIADPKTTIADEIGSVIPDGFDVEVHEDTADTFHLVLPPSQTLTDSELADVVGGFGPKYGSGSGTTW